jgi:hypothetical protein
MRFTLNVVLMNLRMEGFAQLASRPRELDELLALRDP